MCASLPTVDFKNCRTVVSDIVNYTCGAAPSSVASHDNKRIYSSYQASRTGKGECHDIVALSDIPLDNPRNARNYLIAEKDTTVAGVKVEDLLHTAAFTWDGKVRIILSLNDAVLAWREWDPATKAVTGEGTFQCRFDNKVQPMTPEAMDEYLSSRGYTGYNIYRERHDRILASAKVNDADGALYGYLTSATSQPILYRCRDGVTFELIGVVPSVCEYECQIALFNEKIYALGRGMKGDNFFISMDKGISFQAGGRVPDGLCRQQLIVHKGNLLVGYPAPDEVPTIVRNGRNNFHLLVGTGENIEQYKEVLHAYDPMGFIMFEFVSTGEEVHVLWSNAERFPDYVKWGAVQGKDQLLIAKMEF